MISRLRKFYILLKKKYPDYDHQWALWLKKRKKDKEREEIIIGAILTQQTNWKNVERTFENLKRVKICSLKKIFCLKTKKLEKLISPAGFYRVKARYLFNFSKFFVENYRSIKDLKKEPLFSLREKFLKIKGIGPETADSILLYALDKPIFVIDEYTRRFILKYRLFSSLKYQKLQDFFQKNLKKDFRLYQEFHALIVIAGKNKEF